jgi:ribose 5-phosphate isomerase B
MDHRDVYLGSDHDQHDVKKKLEEHLEERGVHVVDLGVFDIEEQVDYPTLSREVVEKIRENPGSMGILLSHVDNGECMLSNDLDDVRAVCCSDLETAENGRKQDDVNLLCLGTGDLSEEEIFDIVDSFVDTEFAGSHTNAEKHED